MLNSLLDIVPDYESGNYYFDNYAESLVYALIGFLIVFAGIIILIGIIWLVGFIMRKTNNLAFLTERKSNKKKKEAMPVPAAEKSVDAVASEEDIPDEVKAAVIAAIMAYYQEQETKCEFTVKRIKRL